MYHVVCCNKYYVVAPPTSDRNEALRIAQSHVDGDYDNCIYLDSKIVGDSSGFHKDSEAYYVDAATQTGMYDAW